jgi:hypothetical protein
MAIKFKIGDRFLVGHGMSKIPPGTVVRLADFMKLFQGGQGPTYFSAVNDRNNEHLLWVSDILLRMHLKQGTFKFYKNEHPGHPLTKIFK